MTLIMSTGFVVALTAPVQQDIIISFGDSKEVKDAIRTIIELNPNTVAIAICDYKDSDGRFSNC